jgi:hypothetical protein
MNNARPRDTADEYGRVKSADRWSPQKLDVFGYPGSGSTTVICLYGFGSRSGSFHQQAKNKKNKKTWISTVL